jgi:uncharacterized protein YacL
MEGLGILLIIFGMLVLFAGVYLATGKKGDFTQVLLWKNNVKKMTENEVVYVGKVTMLVSLSLIISGLLSLYLEESFIPIIVLITSFVILLIIGIKIFK